MRLPTLVLSVIVLASAGCSFFSLPPARIPMDRRDYLEAINTAWKEQLLSNLVRLRYGDNLTLLELKSVAAAYSLTMGLTPSYNYSTAYFDPASWEKDGKIRWFPGHTVSLGGNISWVRNPSITYAPPDREKLRQALINPIPLGTVLKFLQTGWDSRFIFPCLVESINDCRNRSPQGTFPGDANFFKLVDLFDDLLPNGVMQINIDAGTEQTIEKKDTTKPKTPAKPTPPLRVKIEPITVTVKDANKPKNPNDNNPNPRPNQPNPGTKERGEEKTAATEKATETTITTKRVQKDTLSIIVDRERAEDLDKIRVERPTLVEQVITLRKLLEPAPNLEDKRTIYYVTHGNRPVKTTDKTKEIVIRTRSAMQFLTLLSQFIQVPDSHEKSEKRAKKSELVGQALNWCPAFTKGERFEFQVFFSPTEPPDSDTFVKVEYRDHWFYIKDEHYESKNVFSSIMTILSMY